MVVVTSVVCIVPIEKDAGELTHESPIVSVPLSVIV
jgi:hypothetical protein